jgi:chromosome segregation ATPase
MFAKAVELVNRSLVAVTRPTPDVRTSEVVWSRAEGGGGMHRTESDDAHAREAVATAQRADHAERRVAALEATERYLTDQVRTLGERLSATEQSHAELISARAADATDAAWQSVDEAIARYEAVISDRDLELSNLREELARSREDVIRIGEELDRRDQQLTRAHQQLAESGQELARAGQELARAGQELAGTREQLALARRQSDALRSRVSYVTGSRSWRATKPARDVYRWVRRLHPRAR